MREKKPMWLITITCVMTVILAITLIVSTYAWYCTTIKSNDTVVVPADGVFLVGFDEKVVTIGTSLYPAVLMENTIRDNLYYDIHREYNPADENPSYVSRAANVLTYKPTINFTQNPADSSITSYSFLLNASAYVKNKNNEISEINIRELGFNITADIDYLSSSLEDQTGLSFSLNESFVIYGSATISLNLESWITLPDELCDSALIEWPLYINLAISVSANR